MAFGFQGFRPRVWCDEASRSVGVNCVGDCADSVFRPALAGLLVFEVGSMNDDVKSGFFVAFWFFVFVVLILWVFDLIAKGSTPDPFFTKPAKKCVAKCPCKKCSDCKCESGESCSKECTCKKPLHGWYRYSDVEGWQYEYRQGVLVRAYCEATGWYYSMAISSMPSGGGC